NTSTREAKPLQIRHLNHDVRFMAAICVFIIFNSECRTFFKDLKVIDISAVSLCTNQERTAFGYSDMKAAAHFEMVKINHRVFAGNFLKGSRIFDVTGKEKARHQEQEERI